MQFALSMGEEPLDPAVLAFDRDILLQLCRNMGQIGHSWVSIPLFELIVSRRDILEAYKWSREYVFNSLRERGIR